MKVQIKSNDRMSNTQYHKSGKPNWWVLISQGRFADIPLVRGDQTLTVVCDVPEGTTTVRIGCGPRDRHGIRETVRVVPVAASQS